MFSAFEVAVRDFFAAKCAIPGFISTGARVRHDPLRLVRLQVGSAGPFVVHACDAEAQTQLGTRYEAWATITAITYGADLHNENVS